MKYLKMLLYENNELSLTRVIAVIGWLAFLAVSAYLVYTHQKWDNYDTFASLTGGGGAATQVVNKLINSKYNSAPGGYTERK
jgi:hypothetical protein|nr:MAG TPA: protein of unknown function (DUF4500) [Caudoviricetes sp.]